MRHLSSLPRGSVTRNHRGVLVVEGIRTAESATVVAVARRAAARYAWYARMLDAAGFDDDPVASRVPVLPEADLAATYYVDDSVAAPTELSYHTSGTSTGRPKRVRWPAVDHQRYLEQRVAVFSRFLDQPFATACADLGTGHAAAS